jgi:hypothetical protein
MNKILSLLFVLIVLFLANVNPSSAASPQKGATLNNIISETGTIVFNQIEGGFWGIVGDSGINYDPVNLSKKFKKEGIKVRFKATEMKGAISYHMWGVLISIQSIEQL